MVRKIEYTVSESGIAPAVTQFGGVQGEHRATELAFTIESALWTKLKGLVANEGGELIYRFDGFDGEGGVHRSDTASLAESVSYLLEEQLTRYGGTVRAVLVVSLVKSDTTEMELYSFPAMLKLKGLPMGTESEDENHESMSTLAEIAKAAAIQTEQDRDFVEDAEKRVAENLAGYIPLNANLEIIFDGGDSAGGIDGIIVPDSEMSDTSRNAIANKVAKKYIDKLINLMHPVGCYYWSSKDTDPSEFFGGEWERVQGKFILAAGTYTDKNGEKRVYEIGDYDNGEYSHTLLESEMPRHSHGFINEFTNRTIPQTQTGNFSIPITQGSISTGTVAETQNKGESQPYNNMPPYEVAYCWKRIS